MSGGSIFKKSLSGKLDYISRKNSVVGLPNIKKTSNLNELIELLKIKIREARPCLLKEQADRSYISRMTSCIDLKQNADGDMGTKSSTKSSPFGSG
jgi:hypothetical protein